MIILPVVENQITPTPVVQRLRLTFTKEGTTRYISHLDLARALERALNRAGLPVAYTQGFNRRPRLSLAAALPLGYTSAAEIADIWLTQTTDPDLFLGSLRLSMPPGIGVSAVEEVPLASPSIQQKMASSVYEVRFLDPVNEHALRGRVAEFLAADSFIRERYRPKGNKPQSVDLRPVVIDMAVERDENGDLVLHLRLLQTVSQTGRPDDILAALEMDPLNARVHRVTLMFADEN